MAKGPPLRSGGGVSVTHRITRLPRGKTTPDSTSKYKDHLRWASFNEFTHGIELVQDRGQTSARRGRVATEAQSSRSFFTFDLSLCPV